MNSHQYPSWQTFAFKYQGREEEIFEDLARALFRRELGVTYGLFQRVNQKGNETQVIEKYGKIVGFQAKFFKTEIDEDNIIHSMRGAKENNPQQTHYYIYCNLSFGEPRKRKGVQHTRKEDKIYKVAKELGLTIVWKLNKAILDEANEVDWIYNVFFNIEGKQDSLIKEEIRHTETAFASIGYICRYHDKDIHISRTTTIEKLESLPPSSLFVIHGEGGCGKTAILHEFFEKHHADYPMCYRKASVLNVQSLSQVFHMGFPYTMDDFKNAFEDCKRKYFIIDSAEHLEAIFDETIVPSLIHMLIEEGWCVVLTVRNIFLSDLLNYLSLNLKQKNVPTELVELLSDQELSGITRKVDIKLPINTNLRDRLRNLFYLNLYTQYYDEIDGEADDMAFLQFIWEKKIRGKNDRRGYIRENVFEDFVKEIVKTGQSFLPPNKYVSEEFYSLVDDEIVAIDPVNGLFITHDIFEEWGIYRMVERVWQKKTTIPAFLSELGETLSVRRTFRLWLKDKVKEDVNAVRPLSQAAFSDKLPGIWKDEVLCAVLRSDKANTLLADIENKILNNTEGFGEKIIWSLRVGCQYIREVIKLKDSYWSRFAPIGSGWGYIIDLLYKNRAQLNIFLWLPVLHDWTKSNNKSEITRKAGLIALDFYCSDSYRDMHHHDGVKEQVCEIINNSVMMIKEELKDLLKRCINDKNLSDDLPEFILIEKNRALNIQMTLPEEVVELCLFYWKEREYGDGGFNYLHRRGDAFGINEDHIASHYFPPGAGQTPTLILLMFNKKMAVDFIIRLMNECVDRYAQSEYKDYMEKVDIKDENGVINWQWHSGTLWGMFRGMGTPVSPYTLQSVHMALEDYLLTLSKEGNFKECEQILKRLIRECHSSSVSAVAASLVLAYPHKYWKIALILFRTIEFIQADNERVLSENDMNSFYEIGYTLNPTVTKERLKTCKQEFRRTTLENICLSYQIFGNQKELNKEQGLALMNTVYSILDEHRKLLTNGKNQEFLEILLSRMDRRRLKVKETTKVEGGYQIQFETELSEEARKKSLDAAVDEQDMYKYLGLYNWATAKMKGESPSSQIYGDDCKKVLIDAQALQAELNNGRKPYLMDGYAISWVVPCLLKFYYEQLSKKDLEWCKTIVEYKLTGFTSLTNSMDGTSACIHIIPRLIELFPEEKEKFFNLLLSCLHAPDNGNNLSSRKCVITAVQTFDLWDKEPDAMNDMVARFSGAVTVDERLDCFLKLNVLSGLTPDNPNDLMEDILVGYLKQIPKMMSDEKDAAQIMFSVIENLAGMFVRVNSQKILDCLEYTKPIVKESHLGDSFLIRIIIEADVRKRPDRFWLIWNSYRDLLSYMMGWGNSQQLRTYLLNIFWNEGIKEWCCLRQKDIVFYDYVSDNSGGSSIALECIAKSLTGIAHNYQTEGMKWIAKVTSDYPTMNLAGTSALFYLEQVMMEYVYANKMQIRKSKGLHEQVRITLNFMVSKSSVIGYVLRDMVS